MKFVVIEGQVESGPIQQALVSEEEYDDNPMDYFIRPVSAKKLGEVEINDDDFILSYDAFISM